MILSQHRQRRRCNHIATFCNAGSAFSSQHEHHVTFIVDAHSFSLISKRCKFWLQNCTPLESNTSIFNIQPRLHLSISRWHDNPAAVYCPSTSHLLTLKRRPSPTDHCIPRPIPTSMVQEKISDLSNPDFTKATITAYPEGMASQPPGVHWLGDPLGPNSTVIDDRIFMAELLHHLSSTLCIDEARIYAAGLSNGGLTGLLMCDSNLHRRLRLLRRLLAPFIWMRGWLSRCSRQTAGLS